MFTTLYGLVLTLLIWTEVKGHGRLIDPPARSSMWRFGFNTPVNHDDMALYCGGFQRHWEVNGGRCGVCGDPFDGSRDHEAGGKYARGVIAKRYRQGQTIQVSVELTKSHLGWFEFRLCPNNNPTRRVTQACLDENLLRLSDGRTRYQVRSWARQVHVISLRLPSGVSCSQCVLQWRYNAGNSWGCKNSHSGCCLGCGRQEQFYGCADVAISPVGPSGPAGSGQTPLKPGPLGRPSPQASQTGSGFRPIAVGNAQEGHAGGFRPVIDPDHSSKDGPEIENAGGLLVNPGLADALRSRCHGFVQVYTHWCRENCGAGRCSVWLCSRECFRLFG